MQNRRSQQLGEEKSKEGLVISNTKQIKTLKINKILPIKFYTLIKKKDKNLTNFKSFKYFFYCFSFPMACF